jgi:UDP-glucuronate decarboxylase
MDNMIRIPAVSVLMPVDDPHRRKPDITLACSRLDGWTPRISLEEGLKKTIAYFKNY